MRHTSGQLGPLNAELPAERHALAVALREQFTLLLPTSVRSYAKSQALQPSSVTRYLNGAVLPSEEFVIDLVDVISQRTQVVPSGQPQRLIALLHAAQDAQPGTWGHTPRLRKQISKLRQQLEANEIAQQELLEENRLLRRRLQATGTYSTAVELLQRQLEVAQNQVTDLERQCADLEHQLGSPSTTTAPPVAVTGSTYWRAYAEKLHDKGWQVSAVANIDSVSSRIFAHLADPASPQAQLRRGLVLTDVQSSRTASAIGLAAKAIDDGYRLIIVLAGTQNVLRRQFQQRIDEDLPTAASVPRIVRLTAEDFDYRHLGPALQHLRFEKVHPELPLNTPENLAHTDVRLLVVKKNSAVLRKLVTDLRSTTTPSDEIPALVIDLEAGSSPSRTKIDGYAHALLEALPRAQYVSYSTHVSVDPTVTKDIEFLVSTSIPLGFVSGHDFYDDLPPESKTYANSGEKAYVRRVEDGDPGLSAALDAFVVAATVKVARSQQIGTLFRKHSLLVHTSFRRDRQQEMRARLNRLWRDADYHGARAHDRLRDLYESDVLPVSRARAPKIALPETFAELLPALEAALDRIDTSPVSEHPDTDSESSWQVIVANSGNITELTGDGLTVLYVEELPRPADLARLSAAWFGFRPGYTDLVRLYVPRSAKPVPDRYTELAEYWRSGDELRDQLARLALPQGDQRAE